MEKETQFKIERESGWHVVSMRIEEEGHSSVDISFRVGKIEGMENPTVSDLRNLVLSWTARAALAQLPEGYGEGKTPYLPGPRRTPGQ